MKNQQAMLLLDFYKVSHKNLYPEGTETVYSTWTPRDSLLKDMKKVVVFGQQAFIKEYLINYFNENFFSQPKNKIVNEYKRLIKNTLGVQDPETKHIEELHDLGYLPLEIKALPEGTLSPVKVPVMTIQNTDSGFFWLTNYVETLASCELWQSSTSATIANQYRKLLNLYAKETGGDVEFVGFQGHDFSMRGMSSVKSAVNSGMGHLLSFVGTDTVPAIMALEQFYNADVEKELIGTSIPATEHSIQCAYGNDEEYIKNTITKVHPTGFVSMVSDGYDFWDVIGRVLPLLKTEIMSRDGKLVIRPDSGDPVKIVCGDPSSDNELAKKGAVQALWDIFGGTVNDKGFKVLDSHIGLIYGDSITLDRAKQISEQLKNNGFATTNVVYGIGSFTYQYNTRDTFGFALKSTLVKINGDEKQIFKDPKTDKGTKKSQKGAVAVTMVTDTNEIVYRDGLFLNDKVEGNMLRTIFKDGKLLVDESLSTIRNRLKEYRDKDES